MLPKKTSPIKRKESPSKAIVIKHLEYYLDLAKKNELLDVAVVSILTEGYISTAQSGGDRHKMVGGLFCLANDICSAINQDYL